MTTFLSASASNLLFPLESGSGGYVVVLPRDEVLEGQLSITAPPGAVRPTVWIIGGSILNRENSGSHKCINLNNVDAYLEGLYLDKANATGDCIAFFGSATIGGTLYVQNCLAVGPNFEAGGTHGDLLQLQSQVEGVYIDLFTGYTWRQGILWNSSQADQFQTGAAILNGYEFRRINLRAYDTNLNPLASANTSHFLYHLIDDCSYTQPSGILSDVWAYDEESPPKSLAELIRPNSGDVSQAACAPQAASTDTFLTFPANTNIQGGIRYGIPPAGDFVSATDVGLGYVSPWWSETQPLFGALADLWADAFSATATAANPWSVIDRALSGFWDDPSDDTASATAVAETTATITADHIDLDAILLGANTDNRQVSFDVVIPTINPKLVDLDAVLFATIPTTTQLSFDAIIPNTYSAVASLDAAIAKTFTKTTGLDSFILNASAVTKPVSFDASLSGSAVTTTKTLSFNAEIYKTITKTLSLDGLLSKTVTSKTVNLDARLEPTTVVTKTASLGALLNKTVTSKTVSLDARLLQTIVFTSQVNLSGVLQTSGGLQVGLNAVLAAALPNVGADAFLQTSTSSGTTFTITPALDAVLAAALPSAGADAVLA